MNDLRRAKLLVEKTKREAELAYENKLSALKNDDAFAAAYSRASYLKFEIARRNVFAINGVEELEKEREQQMLIVREALKKEGLSELDCPEYHCKKCRDTGFFNGARCECLEKARIEINLDDYKFLRKLPDSLNDIDLDFYREKKSYYAKYVKFLHDEFLSGPLNFCTLLGKPGCGKTYLSYVAAKESLFCGKTIKIINSIRLNRELLEYHCAPLDAKTALWSEIADYDLMVIDDLGVESLLNNVTLQYLYELLTERADKKTVITGNLTLRALEEKYGQRIFSRLSDKTKSAILPISGDDYRLNLQ